jgi:dolichyl-phosphate beta-glucosyltransferase
MIHVSLIIPVYNEHARLIRGVAAIHTYLKAQTYSWEFILVDDGSDIPVSKVINQKHYRVSIIRLPKNQGKGAAIAAGVRRAKGEYIVFSDIDLSVPISRLRDVLYIFNKRKPLFDIVIASRRSPGSQIVVHQPITRELSGRMFTFLSNTICTVGVSDATCGFKGFRARAAKRLFATSKIKRWVFDTEILFLARRYGYSIVELPVSWSNKSGSRVQAGDTITSLFDLLKIRLNEWNGEYNKQIYK